MLRRLDLTDAAAGTIGAIGVGRGSTALEADTDALDSVRRVIAEVRAGGDDALRALTQRFDGVAIDELRVPDDASKAALEAIDPDLRASIELAADQIHAYHAATVDSTPRVHTQSTGARIRDVVIPIDRVGCYVPGGRAVYPSTVLMTVIPARLAGVGEIVLCVPPDRTGAVPTVTLAAAAIAGVDEVYRVGGAQAIAAMAYGTATIRPVDLIVGPGNRYVTLAKREVQGTVGIEALAGPSELVAIADASAPPDWIALDLMAQAEHGPDGSAIVITTDAALADAIDAALEDLVARSPRRAEIESTFASGGWSIIVRDLEHAVDVSNGIAPEHLQLNCVGADALAARVRHAGAVFVGIHASAPLGDYLAGPNHVLPTGRTARFASALRVSTFQKHMHVVGVDESALRVMAPHVAALAMAEGLPAHGESVLRRVGGVGRVSAS